MLSKEKSGDGNSSVTEHLPSKHDVTGNTSSMQNGHGWQMIGIYDKTV